MLTWPMTVMLMDNDIMEMVSGDLKTTMREPVREFTSANEIEEHIIRVDFDT